MVNIKEVVHNSKERFLEVQPNGAGLYIGMQAYEAIKNESEYTDSMKTIIPKMELLTGTLAGKEFTVTTGTVERRSIDNNEFSIKASGVTGIDRCCTLVLFFNLISRADIISSAKENVLTWSKTANNKKGKNLAFIINGFKISLQKYTDEAKETIIMW